MYYEEFLDKYQKEIDGLDFGNSVFKTYYGSGVWTKLLLDLEKLNINPLMSMKSIPTGFFENSRITKIKIPNNITSIGLEAFSYCRSLINVIISDSVTTIRKQAFYDCRSLTSVTIGSGVKRFESNVFLECEGLMNVYYRGSIEDWCNISFSNFDSNPLYYANNLYIDNKLVTDLVIPNTITKIKDFAFYSYSGLKSIIIPDGVMGIGYEAFEGCNKLKSITIPNSVTNIERAAFNGCESLTSITFRGTIGQWGVISKGDYWKYRVPSSCIIHCSDKDVEIGEN